MQLWPIHIPWWGAAIIVVGGAVMLWVGIRRLDRGMRRVGFAMMVIGVALGVVTKLFPTDRDRMELRTRQIIEAANNQDWPKFQSLLDDETVVQTLLSDISSSPKQITSQVQYRMKIYEVSSLSITHLESTQSDTLITVSVSILSRQSFTQDRPFPSDWQFEYNKSGNRWLLNTVTLLRLGNESAEQFLRQDR
jgi:hypothetical protein